MWKKIIAVGLGALTLSGCSLPFAGVTGGGAGSIWKSIDSGSTFSPRINIDDTQRITRADILTMVFHPTDTDIIYVGTLDDGVFRTEDGGESWSQLFFPPRKNYGVAIDEKNGDRLFISGVYNGISKIYRSEDAGKEWKEVYTEPGSKTVITALVSNPEEPNVVYAGTSAGVVIKSTNGGDTWKNVGVAKGPVTKIEMKQGSSDSAAVLVLDSGIMTTTDGGTTWKDSTKTAIRSADSTGSLPKGMISLTTDSQGNLYAGAADGLYRSSDLGATWVAMNIIESSKRFPIRAIDINRSDSNEIIYASGNAFYRSTDGGTRWSTTQLEINRGVSVLRFDPDNNDNIYFGLRKY